MSHHHHAHGHDHHGHDHGHGHRHAHASASDGFGRAFAIGAVLNLAFVGIEAAYGVIANSMALLADAGHNLSDVLALLIAWGASSLARRQPTPRFTYGLGGTSILAALFNAIVLMIAVGGIAVEAIRRFSVPAEPEAFTMMAVAGIGILVNGATALLFARGAKRDLNLRGAFLHMVADAAISAAVVAAGLGILLPGWLWLDPALSLLVAAVIVYGTWGLLRDSVALSLDAVPAGIDPLAVRRYLEALDGVARLHDLHIWAMSTHETALTCHLVMPAGHPGDRFTMNTAEELKHRFGIGHATLQIETGGDTECALAPEHVV
jgi:cobalt-zinc-cadmium efflux system protein